VLCTQKFLILKYKEKGGRYSVPKLVSTNTLSVMIVRVDMFLDKIDGCNPSDVSHPDNEKVWGRGEGDVSGSKVMTPDPAFAGPCLIRIALGGELLAQNGQSRMELICSNIRPAHPALAGEGRTAVQHAMIVNRCMSGSAVPLHDSVHRRAVRNKKRGGMRN
jgi:hypothetical protein